MDFATQSLLPFTRPIPRSLRASGRSGGARAIAGASGVARTRVALSAVPLRHHVIQAAAEQLELSFSMRQPAVYVHEGQRQALERRLAVHAKQTVILAITDNRHSMIHASRKGGVMRVRLHHMFLDAPNDIIDALARFLLTRDREASATVGRYIDANTGRIRPLDPVRFALRTEGDHHDLRSIFNEVNEIYFGGLVDARISWGAEGRGRGKNRTTIKLGSYTAQEQLVRVHPKLDQAWVPRYFVAFVVFHEMLHHVMPATRRDGRRMLHPAEFRMRERTFKHYAKSIAWEKAHLDRLLR